VYKYNSFYLINSHTNKAKFT